MEKIDYLMRDGKYSLRVRKPLRAHLKAKPNGNAYLNELMEKDAKKKPAEPQDKDS